MLGYSIVRQANLAKQILYIESQSLVHSVSHFVEEDLQDRAEVLLDKFFVSGSLAIHQSLSSQLENRLQHVVDVII